MMKAAATAAPRKRARYIKLDDTGARLPRIAATWSQTFDPATGLIWANVSLRGASHADCMAKAVALRIGKFRFRAPTRAELVTLVDDTRRNPAVDVEFFENLPADWHWSSSAVVGWPGYAWDVDFYGGFVGSDHRSDSGFVRPVRVASPRQYSALVKGTTSRRTV